MDISLQTGSLIGSYVLEKKLGEGGFGEVWKVHHNYLPNKIAALKIPRNPSHIKKIIEEAKILSRIDIKGIVKILDIQPEGNPPFLVQEYIEGKSLIVYCRDRRVNIAERFSIFKSLVKILAEAHKHGIIHGDLKPENILIDSHGDPWLIDFGLARVVHDPESLKLSFSISKESVSSGGTLDYLSPEAKEGSTPQPDDDLYALGVILFELYTNKKPVGRERIIDYCTVPAQIENIFRRLYARRQNRPKDAIELFSEIEKTGKEEKKKELKQKRLKQNSYALYYLCGIAMGVWTGYKIDGTRGAMLAFVPSILLGTIIQITGDLAKNPERLGWSSYLKAIFVSAVMFTGGLLGVLWTGNALINKNYYKHGLAGGLILGLFLGSAVFMFLDEMFKEIIRRWRVKGQGK